MECERQLRTACNNYEALKQGHAGLVEALEKVDAELASVYNAELDAAGNRRMKAVGNALEATTAALANAKKLTEGL